MTSSGLSHLSNLVHLNDVELENFESMNDTDIQVIGNIIKLQTSSNVMNQPSAPDWHIQVSQIRSALGQSGRNILYYGYMEYQSNDPTSPVKSGRNIWTIIVWNIRAIEPTKPNNMAENLDFGPLLYIIC